VAARDFVTVIIIVLILAGGAFVLWAMDPDARGCLYACVVLLTFVGAAGWAASFFLPNDCPGRSLTVVGVSIGVVVGTPLCLFIFVAWVMSETVRQDHEHGQKVRLELQRAEEGYPTACISHAEHLLKNADEMSALLEKRCASLLYS